ncbi:MAG: primosomal protein N' [Chloroflexota bacterium]|nr:primosomal protein N' [Chloroflexota bacterium]
MAAQWERHEARYAEIAVDAAVGPERTFTYAIPDGVRLHPGQPVLVPLLSRRVGGVVFALSDTTQIQGIRPVLAAQHPDPVLAPHQLEIAWWLSRETRCTLYEAAAVMLPQDFRRRLVRYFSLSVPAPQPTELVATSPADSRVLEFLARRGRVSQDALERSLGAASVRAARRLARAGIVAEGWELSRQAARPAFSQRLLLKVTVDEAHLAAGTFPPTSRRLALLQQVLLEETLDAAQARKEFGADTVRRLLGYGLLELEQTRRVRDPLEAYTPHREVPLTLTPEQSEAVDQVAASVREGRHEVFLLHGPTGSGKTEVYLRALAECIAAGKRGLLLAPEISLTPQIVARLQARFPGRVGLLHSGLTSGQHYDTWWRVREGAFDVLLGTRSAIFAPMPDLGLVILDEEHEWTYKQPDVAPRYHARSTAVTIGRLTGASVVLGSATPDVATYHAVGRNRVRLLELRDRLRPGPRGPEASPLADVEVVDMREELKEGFRSIFSRALGDALSETLECGRQAILFLNRRGSAGTVQCRDCGHVLHCRSCSTPLTYHAEGERLVCHHCGRRYRPGGACPRCRSPHIRYLGLGTQRVVQEVERTTGARVLRWDRDAARERDAHRELMERFSRGDAQVLVGTQMVAQGLHLPNVTLVGVVLADLGLYLPDFRAGERVFQLLCQVAGRAGRGDDPGRVVVQTYTPEHYTVQAGARQDYHAFYEREVALRRELRNPPFSRLARFSFSHSNREYGSNEARRFGTELQLALAQQGLTEIEVAGPAPGYPARLRGRYRWNVVLRLPPTPATDMPSLLSTLPVPPTWTVDVDPVTLV